MTSAAPMTLGVQNPKPARSRRSVLVATWLHCALPLSVALRRVKRLPSGTRRCSGTLPNRHQKAGSLPRKRGVRGRAGSAAFTRQCHKRLGVTFWALATAALTAGHLLAADPTPAQLQFFENH